MYWKYKIEPLDKDILKAEILLNDLGKDGWELVSTFNRSPNTEFYEKSINLFAILKKPEK